MFITTARSLPYPRNKLALRTRPKRDFHEKLKKNEPQNLRDEKKAVTLQSQSPKGMPVL